ncbi:MAG: hypothetical protein ABL949_00870 [Fimbriimonadaceae bacterium]
MRKLVFWGLLGWGALAQAQVKMQVFVEGKLIGTATVTQKLRQDGSKQVQMSMEVKNGADPVVLRSESIYLPSGAPLRKYQEVSVPAQKMRRTTIVEFSAKGAKVVVDLNGTRSTKEIPLAANLNREDKSEFWFVRDKPKTGATVSSYTFSVETLTWEAVKTSYEGDEEITVGGKKVMAHKTVTARGAAYVDDAGLPLKLDLGNGAMERIW